MKPEQSVPVNGVVDGSGLRAYSGPVHHYTSPAGLHAIVTTGQLRASEASSLNDLAEVTLGWRAIELWASAQRKSIGVKYVRQGMKRSRRDPQHQVFVLSGTTAGDDANQWRLYGDDGRGYALRLDGAAPLSVVSLDPKPSPQHRAFGRVTDFVNVVPWHHVIYRKRDLDRALKALVNHAATELARVAAIADQQGRDHGYEVLGEEVDDELALIAHLFKAGGFAGEKEVRVVARFMWSGRHVGYRAGAYGIAGHVYLIARDPARGTGRVVRVPDMRGAGKPGFVHPVLVTGVRLGPLVHKGNKETVRALLRGHALDTARVRRSQVPLR